MPEKGSSLKVVSKVFVSKSSGSLPCLYMTSIKYNLALLALLPGLDDLETPPKVERLQASKLITFHAGKHFLVLAPLVLEGLASSSSQTIPPDQDEEFATNPAFFRKAEGETFSNTSWIFAGEQSLDSMFICSYCF